MAAVSLLLILLLFIYDSLAAIAVCDRDANTCTCDSGDTCEIAFDVEHLQTFTRYSILNGDIRESSGRVWYINEDGVLTPHNDGSVCGNINDECTDAFTVDGYTFRPVIAINGQFPSPTLIVNEDMYIVINVTNSLESEAITIHWHGMHQRNSYWMDGVDQITQCSIPPGNTFTYVFHAQQPGTHWYHSHSGAQRSEGMFGALIVRESQSVLEEVRAVTGEFEDDPANHTLTFLDWQYEYSIDLFTLVHSGIRFFDQNKSPDEADEYAKRTYSSDSATVGTVSYWSGLINGKGRYRKVPYIRSDLSIFTVQPGKVYRFRLVGAQNLYAYRVSVDKHKLTVVATDGMFITPVEVDYVIINSGERYDFLLNASADYSYQDNFAIRAETLEYSIAGNPTTTRYSISPNVSEAILHYDVYQPPNSSEYESIFSSMNQRNCSSGSPCIALNCPFLKYPPSSYIQCIHIHDLTTMFNKTEDEIPDVAYNDELFFNFGFEGPSQSPAVNGRNFKLPGTPLEQLQSSYKYCQYLDNSSTCNSLTSEGAILSDCTCTHVHELSNTSGSVQLVLSAVGPNPNYLGNILFAHPIHLHGHYFHVVDMQFGEYTDEGKLIRLNTDIDCGGSRFCTLPTWKNNSVRNYNQMLYQDRIATAPLKDTIIVPPGGYVVGYFKTDNPGYWFLHCHVEIHQLSGMAVALKENVDSASTPPENLFKCGDFEFSVNEFIDARKSGLSSTGNSAGSSVTVTATANMFCLLTFLLQILLWSLSL